MICAYQYHQNHIDHPEMNITWCSRYYGELKEVLFRFNRPRGVQIGIVLIHIGFAKNKIDEEDALESLKVYFKKS